MSAIEALRIGLILGAVISGLIVWIVTYTWMKPVKRKPMATGNPHFFSSRVIR